MSGAPKANAELIPEPTPEMVEAGVNAIGPFDLDQALEGGYSEKAELVTQIYRQMAACRKSQKEPF